MLATLTGVERVLPPCKVLIMSNLTISALWRCYYFGTRILQIAIIAITEWLWGLASANSWEIQSVLTVCPPFLHRGGRSSRLLSGTVQRNSRHNADVFYSHRLCGFSKVRREQLSTRFARDGATSLTTFHLLRLA